MEKVKVSRIQKDALDALKQHNIWNSKEALIKKRIKRDGLYSPILEVIGKKYISEAESLYNMPFDDFVTAIFIGYELELPERPRYKNGNKEVSFNPSLQSMLDGKADKNSLIFVKTGPGNWNTLSIKEARDMAKTMNELADYYEKYIVNQNY